MNKLYVFMGYPGSGKTTIARDFAREQGALYLSSDDIREELFGFRDQTKHKETFAELEKRALERKDIGNCLIDATNLNRKDRMKTIERYRKVYELHLFCILRPVDELFDVNELRGMYNQKSEYIPEDVFKRILGKFQLPTFDEGWKTISFKLNTSKDSIEDCIFNYNNMEDEDHDNPHHPETIKEHINFTVNHCKRNNLFNWLADLAYYHDLGKFYVKIFNEEKGYHQCCGHASVSGYIYLIDTIVKYLKHYEEQRAVSFDNSESCRYINIYNFNNCSDILNMYYLIYYHDQPFACEGRDKLLKSLSKPSKPLSYLQKDGKINIELFADILIGFNKIDRMRDEVDR